MQDSDFDWIIVGSGFGGSVSALRLAQKGYRVAVLEMGKRWKADNFPQSNWVLHKFLWLPQLALRGFFDMTLLRDVFILRGIGVGGGSLVYANTLLVPPDAAWQHPGWKHLADWKTELAPHFATAKKMLGVTESPLHTRADALLLDYAREIGTEDSFHNTTVGVFFGEEGQEGVEVPDPYFDGEGPPRKGCIRCGGCMVGCRHNAKNTLDRNYLYLAEKLSVTVIPESRATAVHALEGGGYRVDTERSTALWFKEKRSYRAKGVVLSAGVLGTTKLLMESRRQGGLQQLSPRLGDKVRTNSEAILGVRAHGKEADFTDGIAITSKMALDEHTHLEPVRYSAGSGALSSICTVMTDGGGSIPRAVRWLATCLRHPLQALHAAWPLRWAKQTLILLVMQTVDSHVKLKLVRRWWWPFGRGLTSAQVPDQPPVPSYIPAANAAARALSAKVGGTPISSVTEVVLDVPTTAHILGGCPMGATPEEGVIDSQNRVFGHDDLLVVDGSMIGANLGVNPSLTITALAERAMSFVPAKGQAANSG